ncbi:MAG: hypothetical protein K6E53_07420, partial [Lachnospiraceae bacterium]|nr:hypothetical protein [Lachnospiraceae bacterium]
LFLRTHFLFLDPSEPLILFFIDYLAIMGLFVFIGHYLARLLRQVGNNGIKYSKIFGFRGEP